MSFSRYKVLLRSIQVLTRNSDYTNEFGCRFYSEKFFVSKSPHEFQINPQNDREANKREKIENEQQERKGYPKIKRNFKYLNKISYEKKIEDIESQNNSNELEDSKTADCLKVKDDIDFESVWANKEDEATDFNPVSSDTNTEAVINSSPIKSELFNNNVPVLRSDDAESLEDLDYNLPGPLDTCQEDLSYIGPQFTPTFNFAAYADKSELIQEYVKLGVKLYKVEKNQEHMEVLLRVDLEKELPTYLRFLHDCGVPADCLGDFITMNPMIFKEDLDDMKTRIRYLKAHDFALQSIARIVTKNPMWLSWATKDIDERLGHFQNEFKLGSSDVRFLATKSPKLITYDLRHIHENTFAVREEMGFNKNEIKVLLLGKPQIWVNSRRKILDTFDYLHNKMNLSHLMIASQAEVLTCRKSRVKNRHEFLLELKKVQYDPKKSKYIAPKSVVAGSDEIFCRDIAGTTIHTYNLFLKTR